MSACTQDVLELATLRDFKIIKFNASLNMLLQNIPRILTTKKNLWNHSFTNFYFVFKLIQMIRGSFESRSLILGQCIEFTKPGCRNCNFPSKDNHFANPLVVKRTQSRSLQRPKKLYYHNYVKPTFPPMYCDLQSLVCYPLFA